MVCKNTHQVASAGSKAYRQRLLKNPLQRVKAGAILVMNAKGIKLGENIYITRSGNIHCKSEGTVQIKNGRISVISG
ncbi:MAG: hypothetical protein ABIH40_03655 [Candidatus Omnitrophota bacterium]